MALSDEDRVRLAKPFVDKMLGPIERERCHKHPRRWLTFRWVWDAGGSIECGDIEAVRSCAQCLDDERNAECDE